MKRSFWIVQAIVILFLIVLTYFNLNFHQSPRSIASELNTLGLTGTIVGAVMAAAGIIVTMVSIYSYFTLDQTIERKFETLASEFRKEEKKLTRERFTGFDLANRALTMPNINEADIVMSEAIKLYPDLPGVRRSIGIRFYHAFEEMYIMQNKLRPQKSIVMIDAVNREFKESGSFDSEAEKWLLDAIDHEEDGDGYVSLILSRLYAMRDRSEKVKRYLETAAIKRDCTADNYITKSIYLNVCNSKEDIENFNKWIHWNSPLSKEIVIKSVVEAFDSKMPPMIYSFVALRKPNRFLVNPPSRLFHIEFYRYGESGVKLRWMRESPINNDTYQWLPDREGGVYNYDQVWEIIDDNYWIICPLVEGEQF